MKVFIIEDEWLGLDRLGKLLKAIDPEIEILGHSETIKSAVWWIQNNPVPDLIFMDIELADGQCFEIFNQTEVPAPVIFTTSYDEYALHAFKMNSIDYLLKPIRREELENSLKKYTRLKQQLSNGDSTPFKIENLLAGLQEIQRQKEYRKRFLVKQGQKLLPVEVSDIAWFMAEGKLCFLRTWNNQRFLLDYNLEQLSNMLDPQEFFRLNRSYLAHIQAVKTIHPYFGGKLIIQLSPSAEANDVIVSKEKTSAFKQWMGK